MPSQRRERCNQNNLMARTRRKTTESEGQTVEEEKEEEEEEEEEKETVKTEPIYLMGFATR